MKTLKAMTAKLGTPKLEGNEAVGGKEAPALYFGTAKINNDFDIVDAVGTWRRCRSCCSAMIHPNRRKAITAVTVGLV